MTSRYAVPAACTLGEVKANIPAVYFSTMTSLDMGSGKNSDLPGGNDRANLNSLRLHLHELEGACPN